MNAYERYLEKLLEVKEKELNLYKSFVEKELRCTIQETIESTTRFVDGVKKGHIKIITIPETRYMIEID